MQARRISKTHENQKDALNMLNEALGYISDSDDSNSNIKAAIQKYSLT